MKTLSFDASRVYFVVETSTHLPAEGLQADDDRVEVLSLPQVDGLEGFLRGHAQRLDNLEENVDVLHALERHLTLVDLLHRAGLDVVH